jgi:Glucodextranase, domain B
LLLVLSVAALGGSVFLTASGKIGPLVATIGTSFAGAFTRLTATPIPSTAVILPTNSPLITAPASPYTRDPAAVLQITIPADVVGTADASVRIYVALQGLGASPIADIPIGGSQTLAAAVTLRKGRNDFTATIIRSGVESESSPIVTLVLDQDPPKVTIRSPKNGSTVDAAMVTIEGATEKGATLIVRNTANGVAITAVAAADGTFSVNLPLEPGTNAIHIDATDTAGNVRGVDLSYVQGSGEMSANLSASLYRISIAHHPGSLQLTVYVTDPTGAPLEGATAFFTLQIPGLGPISGTATTDAAGRAAFTTPLVGSLAEGQGQATVLVTHPTFGETTDRLALMFVK